MKNKKSKALLTVIIVVLLSGFFAFSAIIGIGSKKVGSAKNIKLGLDLKGGVSITYEAVGDEDPSSEDLDDTVYKLQKRVETYSTEANVYKEGTRRINVEIPGVTDAAAVLEELGKPGSLYFIKHTNSDGEENYSLNDSGYYELNKTIEELTDEGSIVLSGSDITTAEAKTQTSQTTNELEYVVALQFNETGTESFATATAEAVGTNDTIGIYYDGYFVSVPSVQSEITDGQAVISGQETMDEAKKLASTIRIGGLKVELEEVRSNTVGAQLGTNAISNAIKAGIIGIIIIFIFLIWAYRVAGVASSIALVIYTFLELILINAFDITLTLPGIAGIILSIGMAVDANVIVFERVKEELSKGKSADSAIREGFKKAFSAIIDGNITTLIAAFVLWLRGSGTVKGFSQTLILGIVLSLFTSLVLTKFIVKAFYTLGAKDKKYFGIHKELKVFDFVGKARIWISIVLVGIIVIIGSLFYNSQKGNGALNYSLEFKGGTATTVSLDKELSLEEVDSTIIPLVEKTISSTEVQVTRVTGSNDIIIKTAILDIDKREALNEALSSTLSVEKDSIQTENISSTVSKEMKTDAVIALIIAGICMLIYIWFRFRDIKFALSAVLALGHDIIFVIGTYAILRLSVGNTFIAVMLTIVGYSINATIVIFDRIRENLKGAGKKIDLKDIVNEAISSTLTRSIYTSLTTLVMVVALYILGVTSIKEFSLPLIVGIVCGGFSSVFLTGNIWYLLKKIKNK